MGCEAPKIKKGNDFALDAGCPRGAAVIGVFDIAVCIAGCKLRGCSRWAWSAH